MEYYPVSSMLQSDTAPIKFEIGGQGDEYIDLSQTYLQIECELTYEDGSNLTGEEVPLPLSITSYNLCSLNHHPRHRYLSFQNLLTFLSTPYF